MQEFIKVKCGHCGSILVVRRRDGQLIETREPIVENESGDRFQDAFEKVKARGREVDSKVSQIKRKEAERLKGADEFFKQALERARENDEKPVNPMDQQ